ncbi:hypothetical protein BMS3Abin04_01913 [bacterium BMS3Abin04]|nr:hypothetical protein BMS3Abin04_01913 [bacterium BMS3Abin04]
MKKVIAISLLLFLFVSVSNAQVGKMSVEPNVVLALPLGSFGDANSIGFGGTATFMYRVINQLDLTGSIGYLRWGNKNVDGSFSSIPLLFGARYYFQKGSITPYAGAELGLHFSSSSIELPTYSFGGQTFGGGTASGSSTDFGIGFGGGALFQASLNLTLDATLQYNLIASSGSASYLSLEVGVLFGIN